MKLLFYIVCVHQGVTLGAWITDFITTPSLVYCVLMNIVSQAQCIRIIKEYVDK